MKVRIIKPIAEELLDEAKEDDIIAKYQIDTDKESLVSLRAFARMLDWIHGGEMKFASGMTAREMVARAKDIKGGERKNRIKYLNWMAKMIAGGSRVSHIIRAVDLFQKKSSQLKQKNIGFYKSPDHIIDAYKEEVVAKRVAKARKGRPESEKMMDYNDRNIVYEDDNLFIVRPLTSEASCHYGRKTKWCIAQDGNHYFNDYVDEGKVFYFIKDDRRKNDDRFYKVAIQLAAGREGSIEWEGYWDRYDNPDDNVPLPIKELENAYLPGEMQKMLDAITEHANKYPPTAGMATKLEDLEGEIFNSNYGNQFISFFASSDYYGGEQPHLSIESNVTFNFQVSIFKDQDVEEYWDLASESGMEEELMDILEFLNYEDSYNWEFDDIFTQDDDRVTVQFSLASQYIDDDGQGRDFLHELGNYYDASEIDDLTDKMIDIINQYIGPLLNPGSTEKIKNIAGKIWSLNSGYKYMEAEYNEEDGEIYFAQKEPYIIPVKIPVFNKPERQEARIMMGLREFKKLVKTFHFDRIKTAVENAMKKIHKQASDFAQKQTTMHFKLKPSLKNVGAIPWRTTVLIADFSVDQIRQSRAEHPKPTIRAGINIELSRADDEEEILFAMEYINFVDKYLPEIYELAMKNVGIDKLQKSINDLFRDNVMAAQIPTEEESPLSESKKRIKVLIK
mgnify:FL=1